MSQVEHYIVAWIVVFTFYYLIFLPYIKQDFQKEVDDMEDWFNKKL